GAPVLVVYMGLKYRREIARRLLEAGRAPGEAAAVVSAAGTPEETVMVLTLAEMAGPLPVEPPGPAMLVFGEVVRLRELIMATQGVGGHVLAAGAYDQ
ncbi:MAG TPA: uroporphyrin-III methyltransferase, partial [Alphaproteobacteria bacterium]|nr:uroporphyrin-III methyltransferase [Alphaproteobacteria bacterium]